MDAKSEKHAKSDAQRIDSLYEKRKFANAQRNQISEALKNVDTKSNKKLFADSDDEENIVLNTVKSDFTKTPDEPKKSNWTLFADSDNEEEKNGENDNLITNRHIGKKGAKLMAMEARFGNDERFRMDDKFAEDSDEDPSEELLETQERLHTKKTELEILSKVMGKTLTSKLSEEKRKAEKKMLDMQFVRFDPDNPEHMEWAERKQLERYGEKKDDDAPPKKMAKKEPNAPERLVEGRFFEMDRSFAADLKNKLQLGTFEQSTSFSFLNSIGRPTYNQDKSFDNDVVDSIDTEELPEELAENEQQEDSGDLDATSTPAKETLDQVSAFSLLRQKDSKPWFAIDASDCGVRSVVNNFRCTLPQDKLLANWQNIRTSIIKIYRSQKRSAAKELKSKENRKRKKPMEGINDNAVTTIDSSV